jgi:acetate---CoA ligase (ADP-forming)
MLTNLPNFFSPKSLAIIGASRSPEKVGAIILKNIIDSKFVGEIFPVNPNADTIQDIKAYPSISALPKIPDIAIVAIPADEIIATLKEIGEKGIKNVIVITAGFKETGETGKELENQLIEMAKKYNLDLLGPNCLGFINNLLPINASFASGFGQTGNLRFISQSGALAASIFDWFKLNEIGFSEFITLGNKAIINENDVLNHFSAVDENVPFEQGLAKVNPIGLYLESIADGIEFLKITKEISKKNPIFILKPGKTKEASIAMQSHTGAIAGEDSVFDAALSETGVIRADTLEDFFDLSKGFSWENAPEGDKIAVISNAGGPAVISSDAIVNEGLSLAELSEETKKNLEEILPRASSVLNPIDVLGDALADRIYKAAEIVLESSKVDSLLIILTPQSMTQPEKTAELIGELSRKYQKPIFCSFIGGGLVSEGIKKLNALKIPSFDYPERAIKTISKMRLWRKYQSQQEESEQLKQIDLPDLSEARNIISDSLKKGYRALSNIEANKILKICGFSTPETIAALDFNSAKNAAEKMGWPVVLKISSPNIVHKTDVGGVITEIVNEEELKHGWDKLQQIIKELNQNDISILVQKDIVNGVEVIAGVKKDSNFGPILLFGAGGTLAELIVDKNLKLLPIEYYQVKKIVEKSKIFSILKGFRGGSPYALERLYDSIVRLGKLAQSVPEFSEIEINPVLVTLNDAFALDGKFIFSKQEEKIAGPKFREAEVLEHTLLAGNYHYFVLNSNPALYYQPGQYISVKVAQSRLNAYSIAGHEKDNFSVLIDISPGGPGSMYFKNLKVGDKINFLGPFGVFTLKPENETNKILFLGTGSGCSPLKCILESALTEKNYKNEIVLYFGLRYQNDVFWQERFNQLVEKYPNFKFKLVLSKPDETWQGQAGHITDFLKNDLQDASNCSAYICGNKQMIEEATNVLMEKGCPKERIYFEKF